MVHIENVVSWLLLTALLLPAAGGQWEPLFPGPQLQVGQGPREVASGDLNGDGHIDLAVMNGYQDDTVSILLSNGDGTFAEQVTYAIGDGPASLALGDLDGDGDADLATTDLYDDIVIVLLNQGDGTFGDGRPYAVGDSPRTVAIEDLDGDGDADMAVANAYDDEISILLNHGDGTFAEQVLYEAGGSPSSLAVGDMAAESFTVNPLNVIVGCVPPVPYSAFFFNHADTATSC